MVVRWGVLGAAKFAREHMAPAINAARRGQLVALATSSSDKAKPFEEIALGLRVHDSYEALLADPEVDAVYVPLPNHLHVEWALKAMEAGKHVLVEKPLAMSCADFDKVIAKRDESGVMAAEAYMIVHHPQWKRAKALYESGAIGKLIRVSGAFSYDNSADTQNIRNDASKGGGAIPDIGVYIYGAARFLTGEEPEKILSTEVRRENGVDVWSHITAQFPSFHYTGVVSMRMAPWQEMVFHGDKGVMRLSAPFNANLYGEARIELQSAGPEGMEMQTIRYPADNHYVHQVEAFNAAVLDGAGYACPLEFSRGTQAMIDMVWEAESA
ncbi:Glucose--fructose oxidoreductase precursor [Pelagimonas phthalicica]|uniref:Glucose--fructose oxidoreductase n=1 Tax=Pelagimonas phthalicica TaxID=1037362 RepID=A0A238JAL2_9RHOB|nr:Gfo/Idh/MocA family oxidoreductase [Pelagimonas phthalicica]TDS93725.1 putative dehydrogenase [Pelagimonas phthalicica]SMX27751.1 Glucose--fructose oxidoreductase precursor [Pelagimonas phthalicica]